MNQLSWVIYLAEVIPNLLSTLVTISILSVLLFIGYVSVGSLHNGDHFSWDSEEVKARKEAWFSEKKYLPPKWFVISTLSLWLFVSLVPSKQTIYLIASSQAAETVVTSETGQEILSDIQGILKHQLEKLKGDGQ